MVSENKQTNKKPPKQTNKTQLRVGKPPWDAEWPCTSPCKAGQAHRGHSSLGAMASAGVVPELDTSAAGQTQYPADTGRPACPGSFLLAAVDVQHSSTPSAGTGSFLTQTRGTKHGVNGNTDQAAGSTQAGLQLHNNSQNEMYQMFQPHKEATCMSTCRNCVLPPAVLVSCKSVGKCWCFESYFPFPKLAVPQVCVAQ